MTVEGKRSGSRAERGSLAKIGIRLSMGFQRGGVPPVRAALKASANELKAFTWLPPESAKTQKTGLDAGMHVEGTVLRPIAVRRRRSWSLESHEMAIRNLIETRRKREKENEISLRCLVHLWEMHRPQAWRLAIKFVHLALVATPFERGQRVTHDRAPARDDVGKSFWRKAPGLNRPQQRSYG